MGSKALLVLKLPSPPCLSFSSRRISYVLELLNNHSNNNHRVRRYSAKAAADGSSLQPPDVSRLAETARISLNPNEVEEFAPKIRQVIDWFGQLQVVDLSSVEPAIRADTEGENLRDDIPEKYNQRKAVIAGIPSYEELHIKVPKVLNKD